MASIAGILLEVLGCSVTLQLCLGHNCGIGVLLVPIGVAVLHSEQLSTLARCSCILSMCMVRSAGKTASQAFRATDMPLFSSAMN